MPSETNRRAADVRRQRAAKPAPYRSPVNRLARWLKISVRCPGRSRPELEVVDVRDAPEVEKTGKIAGALHVSRGMLEFRVDPESPYYDKHFDEERAVIVYCAWGGRSALSGKVLKDMGYREVYNLGAFKDWADAAGEVDHPKGAVQAIEGHDLLRVWNCLRFGRLA